MSKTNPQFLARLNEIAGPSISAFARRLSMPQTLVNNYCRGTTAPGYEFFEKMAGIGVDLNWLFTGKKEKGKGRELDIPRKIEYLIWELRDDKEGMAGLEGMIEGYVKARRKIRKRSS